MRLVLIIAALFVLSVVSSSQVMTAEQVVRRTIESGISEGHDQKIIGRMGDAAAVTLTKVLAGKKLTSQDIDLSLTILGASFADLGSVDDASDRNPRTALFVLQRFDATAVDPQLKARIAEMRSRLLEKYASFASLPSQK